MVKTATELLSSFTGNVSTPWTALTFALAYTISQASDSHFHKTWQQKMETAAKEVQNLVFPRRIKL